MSGDKWNPRTMTSIFIKALPSRMPASRRRATNAPERSALSGSCGGGSHKPRSLSMFKRQAGKRCCAPSAQGFRPSQSVPEMFWSAREVWMRNLAASAGAARWDGGCDFPAPLLPMPLPSLPLPLPLAGGGPLPALPAPLPAPSAAPAAPPTITTASVNSMLTGTCERGTGLCPSLLVCFTWSCACVRTWIPGRSIGCNELV
mmetsp:Transcript_57314/g.185660  ORF Transcript_57314/g.185660 Transcript_57314/m.185660 type:complete len:202 (-) Transcript_57314:51-656(-)